MKQICEIVQGPVSAEVLAKDYEAMVREGRDLATIDEHIVVKVPLTRDGIRACGTLSREGLKVNVTLCFSPAQALLAAKAGAAYISPFVGRLDDVATDGMALIQDIVEIYRNYPFSTEVLVASVSDRPVLQPSADEHRSGEFPEGLGKVPGGACLMPKG